MFKSIIFFFLSLCLMNNPGIAQTTLSKIDTLLTGTWKGASLCQVKNSPCHDETVVYHISKDNATDTFYINACKIVNGVEEGMGILPFIYNSKTNQLTSTAYGIWAFTIEGSKLEGTLLSQGELYRKITVNKQY